MAPKRKTSGVAKAKKAHKKSNDLILSVKDIQQLSQEVLETEKYNNLVNLIAQYAEIKKVLLVEENKQVETTARTLSLTLFKCFEKLIKNDQLSKKKSHDEKKSLVVKWLLNKYDSFKQVIYDFLTIKFAFKSSLQIDLLEICLNMIKLESQHMKAAAKDLFFPTLTYRKLIESLLCSANGDILSDGSNDDFILLEFTDKFIANWDLQFYFVHNLQDTLAEWKTTKTKQELRMVFSKFHTVMKNQILFSEDSEKLEAQQTWVSKLPSTVYKASQFKTNFQKCFNIILSYPLLESQYKSILLILHKRIIPYMAQPQSLMDFLTDCYDVTGDAIIPILALNSLYDLMKRFNLEFPDFYTKLYSLLTPDLLYTRYRSRFFRLCDLFLTSTHLSSNLVASFIKRLARLALAASASGVVIVIPFVYNLMKRHPSCMIMVHNTSFSKPGSYEDPFDINESNPLKTNAIGSSLWELETLMSHYHPNIATLAKIFGEPFRKHSYNLEDFLDWSYGTLLESEKNRRYKTMAALEFEEFDSLFDQKESSETPVYASGWTL